MNVSSGWRLEFDQSTRRRGLTTTGHGNDDSTIAGGDSYRAKAGAFLGDRQTSEGPDEPIEDRRPAHARQLERKRVCTPYLGLELDLVERG